MPAQITQTLEPSNSKQNKYQVGDVIRHDYKNGLCLVTAVNEDKISFTPLSIIYYCTSFKVNSTVGKYSQPLTRNPDLTPDNIRIIYPELFL